MTTSLHSLKKCSSFNDFAILLGYQPSSLAYVLYKIQEKDKYTTFEIPKKSGGVRTIQKPNPKLKLLQKKLANLLYGCIEELKPQGEKLEEFKGSFKSPPLRKRAKNALSHGYEKGLSISTNAERHVNKRYVYNIDIESFFPSFNFGRVRGFFLKNKNFRIHPKVATVIAQIACHDNQLPQGSPCSPVISNLIAKNLDYMLLSIAKNNSCTYSRYVDDLTFSTNLNEFPKAIASKSVLTLRQNPWLLGKEVEKAISDAGFKINPKKSRMQLNNSRQEVTGLVVNRKVNVSSGYYKMVRAMCHQLFTEGYFYKPKEEVKLTKKTLFSRLIRILKTSTAEKVKEEIETVKLDSPDMLQGMLAHIYNVRSYRNRFARKGYRPTQHDGINTKHNNNNKFPPLDRCDSYTDVNHALALDGIRNLYGRFLFFKYFYFFKKPLIVCEGKTDNIYLKCAIDSLAKDYPILCKSKENDNQVSFFNKTKTNSEMLKLAEGTPGLTYLIEIYKRFSSQYKCEGQHFPVIILVDCDKAGLGVLRKAASIRDNNRKAKNITQARHKDYYFENLYIVKVPSEDEKKVDIEYLFPDEVLKKELNGKKFNPNNTGGDNEHEYGKAYFAEYIVKANKKDIDFSGFKPLLDNIQDIITSYDPKKLD